MVPFFIFVVIVLLYLGVAKCSRHWLDVIRALGFSAAFVAVIALLIMDTSLVKLLNNNTDCTSLICNDSVHTLVGLSPVLAAVVFVPLLFVVGRRRGIDASAMRPIATYAALYALWLQVTLLYVAFLVFSTMDYHLYLVEQGSEGTEGVIAMWLVMIALSSYTWASSLLSLRRAYVQYVAEHEGLFREIPDVSVFMFPVAWPFIWIGTFPVVWVITYIITSP